MKQNSNDPKLIRVAKYIRVSTDRQARDGDSLREQDDTLSGYIAKHDNMICCGTYIDDGVSGQKIKRDDFARLMADVEGGKVDRIIFTKLDRWFRSLRHYLNTQEILEKHGVTWTAVSQAFFDTTTAHGRAFVAQSMTWAELEAQNDSERILAVFENKVKNGEVISGTAPLGYSIKDKHLVPNEDAEKMQEIFERYQEKPNLRALAAWAADELGIVRTHTQFKRIIQNTKYKGVFRGNENYCEPIIPPDLWEECNRLLCRNHKSNKKYNYVFTGLLRCGDCGRALIAAVARKHKDGKALKPQVLPNGHMVYGYPGYRCQARNNKLKCGNKKIFYEKTLEKRLLACIKPEIEKYVAEYQIRMAPALNAETKISKYEKKIERLKELYINELISLDEFKADRIKFENEIAKLNQAETPKHKDLSAVQEILKMDIETLYATMTVDEKNQFWRSFIDYIELDNDHNMKIHFL